MPEAKKASSQAGVPAVSGRARRPTRAQVQAEQAAAAEQVQANLGTVLTLPQFLATTGQLSLDDRDLLVKQALLMIDNLYVHLPLKRAVHAIDPVQKLRVLRVHEHQLSEFA